MNTFEQHAGQVSCALRIDEGSFLPFPTVFAGTSKGVLLVWTPSLVPTIASSSSSSSSSMNNNNNNNNNLNNSKHNPSKAKSETSRVVSSWPLRYGKTVHALGVSAIAVNGQFVATASQDATIFVEQLSSLWAAVDTVEVDTAATTTTGDTEDFPKRLCTGHTLPITYLDWASTHAGNSLLSLSYDGSLRMFDVISGSCLMHISHRAPLLKGLWSAEGTMYFVVGDDGYVAAVDLAHGQRVLSQAQRMKSFHAPTSSLSMASAVEGAATAAAVTELEWGAQSVADRQQPFLDSASPSLTTTAFASSTEAPSTAAKRSEAEELLRRGRHGSSRYRATLSLSTSSWSRIDHQGENTTTTSDGDAAPPQTFPRYFGVLFESSREPLVAEPSGDATVMIAHRAEWRVAPSHFRWHIATSSSDVASTDRLGRSQETTIAAAAAATATDMDSASRSWIAEHCFFPNVSKRSHPSPSNNNSRTSSSSGVLGLCSWCQVAIPTEGFPKDAADAFLPAESDRTLEGAREHVESLLRQNGSSAVASPAAAATESSKKRKRSSDSSTTEAAAAPPQPVARKLALLDDVRVMQEGAREGRVREAAEKRTAEREELSKLLAQQQAVCDELMEKLRVVAASKQKGK